SPGPRRALACAGAREAAAQGSRRAGAAGARRTPRGARRRTRCRAARRSGAGHCQTPAAPMNRHYDALETRDPALREREQMARLAQQVAFAKSRTPAYAERFAAVDAAEVRTRA